MKKDVRALSFELWNSIRKCHLKWDWLYKAKFQWDILRCPLAPLPGTFPLQKNTVQTCLNEQMSACTWIFRFVRGGLMSPWSQQCMCVNCVPFCVNVDKLQNHHTLLVSCCYGLACLCGVGSNRQSFCKGRRRISHCECNWLYTAKIPFSVEHPSPPFCDSSALPTGTPHGACAARWSANLLNSTLVYPYLNLSFCAWWTRLTLTSTVHVRELCALVCQSWSSCKIIARHLMCNVVMCVRVCVVCVRMCVRVFICAFAGTWALHIYAT